MPVFLRFLSLVFALQGQGAERVLEQVVFNYIFHLRNSKEQMFSLYVSYFFLQIYKLKKKNQVFWKDLPWTKLTKLWLTKMWISYLEIRYQIALMLLILKKKKSNEKV